MLHKQAVLLLSTSYVQMTLTARLLYNGQTEDVFCAWIYPSTVMCVTLACTWVPSTAMCSSRCVPENPLLSCVPPSVYLSTLYRHVFPLACTWVNPVCMLFVQSVAQINAVRKLHLHTHHLCGKEQKVWYT